MTAGFFTEPGKLTHVADPVERMATLALHAAAIGMSRELGTDGHIVPETVLEATGLPPQFAKTLMTDGLWHQADHGCPRCPQPRYLHVYLHDILNHNRTAEQERRIAEQRRGSGAKGLATRWDGHQKPEKKPARPPGRPRKNPPADPHAGVALVAVEPGETPPVAQHPAEARARARRGRPRRTEPRVFDPIVVELCDLLADQIAGNDPDGVRPNVTDTWRNQCRLMIEKDGREPEKIRKAILWCQKDSFWHANIKSMPTLRTKYATLSARAHEEKQRLLGRAPARRPGDAPAAVAVPGMNALYDDDNIPGAQR